MENPRSTCVGLLIAVLANLSAASPGLAEKYDCSGSKKSKQLVSREVIKPGDRPYHELVQSVRVDVYSNGNEETVYNHDDQIAGTGTHYGYAITSLATGEELWTRHEGVHYTIIKGDSWESRFQGIFHFIGGTGKYKAVHGGGYYQGTVTPSGVTEEVTCEAEY